MGRAARDLDAWLDPFLAGLGHKKRRIWAPLYLRGLLGPGERKSLQPMAACPGLSGHDQLQHFIASPAWDDGPLWRVLAKQADRLVGGSEAALVIDDTALPKQGTLSVGVARQYCGQLGKRANCQALVSLTLAGAEVPVPVGFRLFLPEEGTADPERCAAAGGPEPEVVARSKGAIALAELDRLTAADVRFGIVLADTGCGASAEFRHGLDERDLRWAVGVPRNQKVYGADVQLVPPGGRKRRPVPDQEPRPAEDVLAEQPWHQGGARCPLRRHPHPCGRWRDLGQQPPPARRRGLAGGRVALERRAQALPRHPAAPDITAGPRRGHQRALGLRAGASAPEAGTGLGPLRGAILDRAAQARADDLRRLRLAAAPPPRRASLDGVGEKCRAAFRDHHRRQACQRRAAPSSGACSPALSRLSDGRIAGTNPGRHLTSDCPSSASGLSW